MQHVDCKNKNNENMLDSNPMREINDIKSKFCNLSSLLDPKLNQFNELIGEIDSKKQADLHSLDECVRRLLQ